MASTEREDLVSVAELTTVQQQAVEALRRDGVAVVPFADLFPDGAGFWQELTVDIDEFVRETEAILPSMSREERSQVFGKAFLVRRYRPRKDQEGASWPTFDVGNPWVRFGVSDEIVRIVNAYRGCLNRLYDVDNWYTVPDPEAGERIASQRWHRDGWEDHLVKVFTYFCDVDGDAGPFEYVKSSAAGGRYGSLWPWQDKEVYPPQDELVAQLDERDCISLTGPAGSIVLCDTSGFHRGGFARTKPRILSYHTYLSDEGFARHRRKFEIDWSNGGNALSPESRYALE